MLDVKMIRAEPDAVREGIRNKGAVADLDRWLELDAQHRRALAEWEDCRQQLNKAGKLIAEKRLTTLDEMLALMEQVCEGVGYAHSKSVVHRDLKPANIHVLADGRVKVMDFGLARIGASSGMTQTGTVLGTPHYMSPEQVKGQKADSRSDVFALGAILYELLTGHQPFEAESMHAVLFRILESEPEPVRRWYPDAPAPIVS